MILHRILWLLLVCACALVALMAPSACAGPREYIDVTTLEEFPPHKYVYTIAPGDEIRVEIEQDEGYNWKTTVLPDGQATFRWAGELDVMGLTLAQTRDLLKKSLKDYYNDPRMSLQLLRFNGPDPIIYFGGLSGARSGAAGGSQSSSAGLIPYRTGIGLMEAMAVAGGPTEPDIDIVPYIYVVRNIKSIHDRKVYRFDLAAAVRGGSPDLPMHPGDVIFLDQSWLQDLGRALGIVGRVVGTGTGLLGTALLIDAVADGAFTR